MHVEKVRRTVGHVVDLLARRDYAGLEQLSRGVRLAADDIKSAVTDYGRTISVSPAEELVDFEQVVEIENSNPQRWYVAVDLWTEEEGRSDLTLELTLIDSSNELLEIDVDNLHVL